MKRDKHLPPAVYLNHGAYYHVRNNKWVRIGATLQEALLAYANYIAAPAGTMPRLIDDALEAMRVRKPPLSKSTLDQYKGAAKILKHKLEQFRPEQVQGKHVAAIRASLVQTPNMANRCLTVLRLVFDYALELQIVANNPAIGIKRHRENKRGRLISSEEYARIYAQAGPRLQVIMDLAIRTGQRITAVLKIKRADLLPDGIRFGKHKTDSKGTVAWTSELRRVVERAKALRGGNVTYLTYLLPHRDGDKPPDYRSVKDQWDKAVAAAGVEDATLHDLRAMAATTAKRQGKSAQALLMHTSPKTTERYLRDKQEPVVDGPAYDDQLATPPKS